MSGPVAILVGAPGAGKTTVGRMVAAQLGIDFSDTDEVVVQRAGKPVSDIFVDLGEETFRAWEEEAVSDSIEQCTGVLALGGGAILSERTRNLLRSRPVVWLQVSAADASARVGMNTARPLLLGNVRGQLSALLDARTPLYEEVAAVAIPTGDLPAEDVANLVVDWVRGVRPPVSDP